MVLDLLSEGIRGIFGTPARPTILTLQYNKKWLFEGRLTILVDHLDEPPLCVVAPEVIAGKGGGAVAR